LAAAGLGQKETAVEEGRKAKDLIEYENLDKSDMILNLAKIYTITGDYEQAKWTIDYLLKIPLSIPSCFSGYLLKIDPVWQPLIQDPEYQALVNEYLKN
jgi:serine/threonine-protein kinase